MTDELLTTRQAAEKLNVSVRMVQFAIQRGQLPAERMGRDWLIRASDLEQFAAQPRLVGYPKGRPRKQSDTESD